MSMLSGVDCPVSAICPSSIDESLLVVSPSSKSSSSTSMIAWTGVLYKSPSPKLEGVDRAVLWGESGGVGCSSGLIDLSVTGSLCLCLSGIATCRGDSCCFPVIGDGCLLDQLGGLFLLTNSLSSVRGCLGNGVVRMGRICGNRDDKATGSEDFVSGKSSFRFPVTGSDWTRFHSGGVGLLDGSSLPVRGFFGSRGVVQLGVIETMRGNSGDGSTGSGIGSSGRNDDEATGGDDHGVIPLKGGISHGRGMRSRDEGPTYRFTDGLDGGNGISSGVGDLFHGAGMIGVAALNGGDGVSDWGRSMLAGSGVLFIGTGGSYCSIDEYWHRCDPQGTKGSGGDATWGGSTGKLGGVGTNGGANGDGFTRGGDGTLGTTGGNAMTSLGNDDDGWMYCRITGIGPT